MCQLFQIVAHSHHLTLSIHAINICMLLGFKFINIDVDVDVETLPEDPCRKGHLRLPSAIPKAGVSTHTTAKWFTKVGKKQSNNQKKKNIYI